MKLPNVDGLRAYPPASEADILALEQRMGQPLPAEYRLFLLQSNGFSVAGGLLLYSTEIIEERNSTHEVSLYAPGYLAIGGTGGGEIILIRQNDDGAGPFIVDVGAMTPNKMRDLSTTLERWFDMGCLVPED